MNIERTLFWFQDRDEQITSLSEDFFGLSILLNRLLNEKYDGKKIKFVNIYFYTDKTYEMYPMLPKETPYYFGGHLKYYGAFNKMEFMSLNKLEQYKLVWRNTHKYLIESANAMKNNKLAESADYAYHKGLLVDLNPDYRLLETSVTISGKHIRASVWINFKEDGMYSKLTIEEEEVVIFEKEIDKTKNGVEFFLEMYKSIVFEGNDIVIKGRKDVDYLPLKIGLPDFVLEK